MEVKDLRVGNYIKAKKSTTVCENHFELDIDRFSTLILNKKQIEYFEPILLTEEWLVRLGLIFDKTERQTFLIKYNFYIRKDHEEDEFDIYENINDSFITSVSYVHQLQNLCFALTGEELTIKN